MCNYQSGIFTLDQVIQEAAFPYSHTLECDIRGKTAANEANAANGRNLMPPFVLHPFVPDE